MANKFGTAHKFGRRPGSPLKVDIPAGVMARIRAARDREWNRALGIKNGKNQVLTPEQAAEWLQKDRVERARNVHDARPRRTPANW